MRYYRRRVAISPDDFNVLSIVNDVRACEYTARSNEKSSTSKCSGTTVDTHNALTEKLDQWVWFSSTEVVAEISENLRSWCSLCQRTCKCRKPVLPGRMPR